MDHGETAGLQVGNDDVVVLIGTDDDELLVAEHIESLDHQRAGGYGFDAGLVTHDVENAPLAIEALPH